MPNVVWIGGDPHRRYALGIFIQPAKKFAGTPGRPIAQLLFYVFLVIFVVVLIMNFVGRGRGPVP